MDYDRRMEMEAYECPVDRNITIYRFEADTRGYDRVESVIMHYIVLPLVQIIAVYQFLMAAKKMLGW